MNKIAVSLLLMAAVLAASGCGGNKDNATDTRPPASSPGGTTAGADVEALYKANCVACHGADMSGGMGPALKDVGTRLSAEQIAEMIANGGNSMRAFKGTLSDEEINALAQWLSGMKG